MGGGMVSHLIYLKGFDFESLISGGMMMGGWMSDAMAVAAALSSTDQ